MAKKNCFLFSLCGHLLLIVSAFIYFHFQLPLNVNTNKISTYVYSTSTPHTSSTLTAPHVKKSFTAKTKSLSGISIAEKKMSATVSPLKKSSAAQYQEKNETENTKTILQLLHNAIAETQTYPETAAALNQTGTVKIGFHLYPDGRLMDIKIVVSSGFESIDNAALTAVTAISPVPNVQNYLSQARYFTVDVIFS